MDPKDLIAALAVLADPNASDEDKAAALDKLSAHCNSLLDAKEAEGSTESSSKAGDEGEGSTESSSEAGDEDGEKKEPSKEMASALATIEELKTRLGKLEKASAAGNAPRAATRTVLRRTQTEAVVDPIDRMIDNAVSASRKSAGASK